MRKVEGEAPRPIARDNARRDRYPGTQHAGLAGRSRSEVARYKVSAATSPGGNARRKPAGQRASYRMRERDYPSDLDGHPCGKLDYLINETVDTWPSMRRIDRDDANVVHPKIGRTAWSNGRDRSHAGFWRGYRLRLMTGSIAGQAR